MIERVAQALRISLHLASDREREAADRAARAVLQAIREPTDAMVKAGGNVHTFDIEQEMSVPFGEYTAHSIFPVMIDAALNDPR